MIEFLFILFETIAILPNGFECSLLILGFKNEMDIVLLCIPFHD